MYVVLAGEAGTGKTVSADIATDVLKDYNQSLGPSNGGIKFSRSKVTPAALIKNLSEATKLIKAVPGVEQLNQSAMYIYSSEFGVFIEDIGGGYVGTDMLMYYDCPRLFEKETLSGALIKIPNPCVNLLACTTPSFLSSHISHETSGTGLVSRMIFAAEFDKVTLLPNPPAPNKLIRGQLITELGRIHRMSGEMRRNPAAEKLWEETFYDIREKLQELPGGSFRRNFYARKLDYINKLSMVLSACRTSNRIIEPADIERARSIIEEAEPHMEKSFGVKDFKRIPDAAKQVYDMMPEGREIPKGQLIQDLYRSGVSGALSDLDNILKLLVEGKMVRQRIIDGGADIRYTRV
jgi:hypothetical protein